MAEKEKVLKKQPILAKIIFAVFAILIICGVIFLIIDDTSLERTIYEVAAYAVTLVSMGLAVFSWLEVGKRDKVINEMTRRIREIGEETDKSLADDAEIARKLNEVDHEDDVELDIENDMSAKINEILRVVEKMDKK
ncbi:MAG: hypothetical protein LBM97_00330 [Candidatus Nomurabacteria bacterium]|jgi:hypothetical protein|nr:hypothetical protein [Candidatus Nomurabacteria bacterium]